MVINVNLKSDACRLRWIFRKTRKMAKEMLKIQSCGNSKGNLIGAFAWGTPAFDLSTGTHTSTLFTKIT
jgi:hypothetical protein